MAERAAFQATFTNIRNVKTRGVTEFVFEVPSERAQGALEALGGMPSPSSPQMDVAIARIRFKPDSKEPPMDLDQNAQGKDASRATFAYAREEAFQRWILGPRYVEDNPKENEVAATEELRKQIGIKSRTELPHNPEAVREWRALVARYKASQAAG